MYGLPRAGLLAQKMLVKRSGAHGYTQSKSTPGFWKHESCPISFCLILDDFGIKCVGKEHVDHLVAVLKDHYKISEDWEGTKYCRVTFDWDYERQEVHLSIRGYVNKTLQIFQHELQEKTEHQSYVHTAPAYSAKIQYAKEAV